MKFLVWLLAITAFSVPCRASGLVVVVPSDSPLIHLDVSQVREFFLAQREASNDGVELRPYDSSDDYLREIFYRSALAMDPVQYKAYWARMVFSGQKRPPRRLQPSGLAELEKGSPWALAYVADTDIPEGWRVVLLLPVAQTEENR